MKDYNVSKIKSIFLQSGNNNSDETGINKNDSCSDDMSNLVLISETSDDEQCIEMEMVEVELALWYEQSKLSRTAFNNL